MSPPRGCAGPVPEPCASTAVSVRGVSKWFGSVVAVSGVSFDLEPGVSALLGPNGAGKSTLMRLMAGLARPSAGQVLIFGVDPRSDPEVFARVGISPQQEGLLERQRALEFVTLAAALQRLPEPQQRAATSLRNVGLDPGDPRPLRQYSKGMRQRVKLAQALVNEPDLVFLDEPMEGLDPRQRLAAIELLEGLAAAGKTVVVSSHVLAEVERFACRVLVVAQGRLLAEGPAPAIRDLLADQPRRFRVITDRPGALAGELVACGLASSVSLLGDAVELASTDARALRVGVAGAARRCGARLFGLTPLDEDLESVFGYLVGRR